MRIGELSESTGTSVRSLRYYEQQGLLTARRSPSGQRHYDGDAISQVRLIQLFLRAGLPTTRILEMLPCVHSGTTTRSQRDMLDGERQRLEGKIEQIREARDQLITVIRDAERRADPADA